MKVKLLKMTEETPKIPAIEAKSPTKRVETSNIKNKTLVNELQWVKSTKVKLLKMTEEKSCNRGKVTKVISFSSLVLMAPQYIDHMAPLSCRSTTVNFNFG